MYSLSRLHMFSAQPHIRDGKHGQIPTKEMSYRLAVTLQQVPLMRCHTNIPSRVRTHAHMPICPKVSRKSKRNTVTYNSFVFLIGDLWLGARKAIVSEGGPW